MYREITVVLMLLFAANAYNLVEEVQLKPYDVQRSKEIVVFASLAYCPRPCIDSWNCKSAGSEVLTDVTYVVFNLTQAPGYIGYSASRNAIILSFRGSSNIQNWIENLNFQKVPYIHCLRCEIHSGFYADYLGVASQVTSKVQAILSKHPTATLIATGHSLGGALAEVAALELKRTFPSLEMEVHHYGGPRIGNVNLAKHLNNKIETVYRVVHHKDIVPHLPPDLPEFEYHHSAYEVFWNEDYTEHKVCGASGEDKSCSNQYFPDYSAADHDIYFIKISSPKC